MEKILGNHIVVLKNQIVMAANEIEATPVDAIVRLGGTISYEKLSQLAFSKLESSLGSAHLRPIPTPNVDLSTKIRPVSLDLG
jgi:hypothetical protein